MIAAALLLAMATTAPSATPAPATCAAMIRRGNPAAVDGGCWRIGPLSLGMSAEGVTRTLGPASASYVVGGSDYGPRREARYREAIYVFPRDLSARLAAHPVGSLDFRLLELTFDGERLVRIDNAPGYRVSGPRCDNGAADPRPVTVDPQAFAPFQTFAGVRVGERLAQVRRVLGRSSSVSTGRDFLNYAPIPLTLTALDTERLSGFAIGADGGTVVLGSMPSLAVDKDPATCRVRGFRFVTPQPGG